MSNGITVAVLGGDRRMAEAVHFFRRAGLAVRLAGLEWTEPLDGVQVYATGAEALAGAQAAVLPVQGASPSGAVYTAPGAPPCTIDGDGLGRMEPGSPLFVGIANPSLSELCAEAQVELVEYREADEFATWNSVPSAEGAIQMAMEATPFTIFGSRSLVLGFGRTGKATALLLRGLFSDVSVAARSEIDQARIWAGGYRPVAWRQLPQAVGDVDLIFNTVPSRVLTRSMLAAMPRHAVVIDLASAPGGTDFAAARDLGIQAKLAPGLPGIVAPATAGRIIAEFVLRHLRRNRREEEEER